MLVLSLVLQDYIIILGLKYCEINFTDHIYRHSLQCRKVRFNLLALVSDAIGETQLAFCLHESCSQQQNML